MHYQADSLVQLRTASLMNQIQVIPAENHATSPPFTRFFIPRPIPLISALCNDMAQCNRRITALLHLG